MQRELSLKTAFYQKRHKRQKNWKKVFMILASVVVFCTTYALILPAITMEPDYICGYDAHIHNEDCYRIPEATPVTSLVCESASLGIHKHTTECFDENGEPKWGIADFVLHTHSSDCFGTDGELLCTLPEIEAHVHDESCWQQPHVHEEACYTQVQGELLCTIEEGAIHTHNDTCYTSRQIQLCELAEEQPHTHGEGCYTQTSVQICQLGETEEHTHTAECYQVTDTLTCELEETEGHLHSESCFDTVQVLTCTQEADIAHIHNDACYNWTPQLNCAQLTAEDGAQPYMICEKQELYPHTHTSDCFTSDNTLICTLLEVSEHIHNDTCFVITLAETDEPVLMCDMEVHEHTEDCIAQKEPIKGAIFGDALLAEGYYCGVAEHSHQADTCYDEENNLMCTMAEHEHTWICELAPADLTDMETEDDWEATLPELQGNIVADLIAVAESQLGYEESTVNYLLTDEEELLYYSRYGAWWDEENPYGDWNAEFVSFCLNYAGITDVPLESDVANWPDTLVDYDQWFVNDGTFIPNAADLVFFDTDSDNNANRAGIITYADIENNHMTVIHERNGKVRERDYTLDDSDILGYARNPGNELTLDLMDYSDVQNVINLIDAMPSADEIDEQMMAYEDAEDYEGLEAWYTAVVEQVHETYRAYYVLPEEEKALVTNADKLLELEYIWSQAILIEDISWKAPTTIKSTSTRDFIELNLYDYNGNINTNYNNDSDWPGFQWNGGAYDNGSYSRRQIDYIDFGNSMITDRDYAGSGNGKATTAWNIGRQGGAINEIVQYPTGDWANKPVGISNGTEVLGRNLTTGGYPWVTNAGSMVDYFSNSSFATKMNTSSIDGLFQKNEVTGEYYYYSRWNHAQYSNNKFTLYDDIITPNFITYPFGNFLPFNDITRQSVATNVGSIGAGKLDDYIQGVINDLVYGSSVGTTEQQLIDMLAMYRNNLKEDTTSGGTAWTTWSAKDAIYDYILNGPTDDDGPITDALLNKMYNIDWDVKTNFFFGMEMKMNFMQPKNGYTGNDTNGDGESDYPMVFYFTGDDDVWVYIDGVLFLDLSGIHRHVGGEIDFVNGKVHYYALSPETGDVSTTPYATYTFEQLLSAAGKSTDVLNASGTFKDYSTHAFNFYYMERGSGSSVCRINFNFPLLRQNSITVTKETSPTDNTTEVLGSPDYYFSVIKKTGGELVVPVGTAYDILDSGGNVVGAGTVDQYGMFKLKAGQTAVFAVTENIGDYYVQELIPEPYRPQYGENVGVNDYSSQYNAVISWTSAGRPWAYPALATAVPENAENPELGPPLEEGGEGVVWYGFSSNYENASDSQTFLFRMNNHVDVDNLGSLRIEKQLIKVDDFVQLFSLEDPTFNMTVTLDGFKLPVGTAYTVYYSDGTTANKNVTTAGVVIVPAGGSVLLDNILAGTEYTVTEQDDGIYYITYQYPDENGQPTTSTDKASGVIAVDTQVAIRVVNSEVSVKGELTIHKTVVNPDSTERDYTFQIVQVDDDNELVEGGLNETITMSGVTDIGSAGFQLGYAEADIGAFPATYYYRITEVNDKEDVLDNTQIFLAEVTVEKADGKLNAQVANLWSYTTDQSGALIEEAVSNITFQNTLVGSLTLSKEVVGTTPEGGFTFRITLTDEGGQPVTGRFPAIIYQQSGEEVPTTRTFDANGINLVEGVMDGESIIIYDIPYDTTWTIEEINADGYVVTYKVNDGESQSGAYSTGSITVGDTEVAYTNSAMYALPETGGSGVARILTCGGLLTIMPCLWLLRRQRYRGRRVTGG